MTQMKIEFMKIQQIEWVEVDEKRPQIMMTKKVMSEKDSKYLKLVF